MKNNIIYQFISLLFKRAFFAVLLLTAFCFNAKAQPGTNDPSFDPGTGANNGVSTTAIQSDGKILIGGLFTSYNGTSRNYIARLNTDGTLDASFNSGTGANNWVYTTAIQSDGKILIGGEFTSYNGTSRNRITRLNADGTLDASFNPGTGAYDWVFTTAIQSDGKIIIGGEFPSYNGTSRNRIARLNADGTLDASFNPGTGANDWVLTTAIQSDGKIIIGGKFTSFNGTSRNYIARLNADGTLDASFNPGTGANNMVYSTAIQSDGKIIIGGDFTSYNGTSRNRIARLNADGTLDASFNPGTGINDLVHNTAIQGDGKILIGGRFTSYNGTSRNRIARLNADGTLDLTFNHVTGANDWVYTTAIQSDGKIIIGGQFTSYNEIGRNRIARIIGGNVGISSFLLETLAVYPNPVSNELNIEMEENAGQVNFEIYNIFGQVVCEGNFIKKTTVNTAGFAPGVYLVKVGSNKGYEIKNIVKQ